MLKLAGVGLVLMLVVALIKIAPHIQKARRDHAVVQGVPPGFGVSLQRHRTAEERGYAGRRNTLGSSHARTGGSATMAPPRAPFARKSSRNNSTAAAIWPAPVGAPLPQRPSPGAKPAAKIGAETTAETNAETTAKATLRILKTKTTAEDNPPQAKNGSPISHIPAKIPPKIPSTIIAARRLPAPARANLRVQLGAVKSKAAAVKEARRLIRTHKSALDGLKIVLVRADLGKRGVFYRLLAGPVSDNTAADSLCRQLSVRKQRCMVINR